VLSGGVTLYEACAIGLPAIGISVVPGQRPSVAGLARLGAVVDGGHAVPARQTADRVARLLDNLIDAPVRRRALSTTARRVVDGHGARRVAAVLRPILSGARTPEHRR